MDSKHFSTLINDFKPGIFGALNEKKEELLKEGRKVYNLSVGTPDFEPPLHVMKAMEEACKDPNNYKYSLADMPELLEAVQYRYEKRFGVHVEKDEIMSVYGSQEAMAHIGMVFCDPDNVILVPNPGYPMFEMSGILAKANVEYYTIEEENGYLPDLDSIPEEVLKKTKYMIVSYPLNPVCVCAPDEFYEKLIAFAKKNEIVILTATSGDTGKAAMAGFADVEGTRIIVFYPKNGVSKVQELQMRTQKGANVDVVAIHGNFDNAQSGVKQMFEDQELAKELADKGYQFSSANSINIGRLVPQMVYYVYAYTRLVANGEIKAGDKINVVVPTGNFGNILAAFYAKQMGLPINKFICASNENKVLYDFFRTGTYDRKREFILTTSPSMDILISSNLERLIYRIAGNDAEKNKALMQALNGKGAYTITDDMKKQLADFYGNYASEAETAATIKRVYESDQYIMDTHTAVAASVYDKYVKETGDTTPTVIASTASPYKFTRSVMNAIDSAYDKQSDFELVDELNKLSGVKVPQAIEDIRQAEVRHDIVCDKEDMLAEVKKFLNI